MVNSTSLGPLVTGPPTPLKGMGKESRDKPQTPGTFKEKLEGVQKNQGDRLKETASQKSIFQKTDLQKKPQVERSLKEVDNPKSQATQSNEDEIEDPRSSRLQDFEEKVVKMPTPGATQMKMGTITKGQEAVLKFMDSMESEFGVPREEIVEAMTQLKGGELIGPPEETAHQVIEKLDLDPQQEVRAEAMYLQMVKEWNQKPISFPVETPVVAAGAAVLASQNTKEVVTPRMALNRNLDMMNDKFFMKGAFKPNSFKGQGATDAQTLVTQMDHAASDLESTLNRPSKDRSLESEPMNLPASPPMVNVDSQDMALADNEQPMVRGQSQNESSFDGALLRSAGVSGTGENSKAVAKPLGSSYSGLKASSALDLSSASVLTPSDFSSLPLINHSMPSAHQQSSQFESSQEELLDSEEPSQVNGKGEAKADFFVNNSDLSVPSKAADPVGAKSFIAGAGAAGMAVSTKNADEANLQMIAGRAQVIAKHGGGEMKLRLYPEGLGQLDLKVRLQDGKVNLEMVADTPEVKKMIENNLSDLRTHLSSHSLSVDQVKVDVAHRFSPDSGQGQMSGQSDFARDQARQFFSQLRDENLAQKHGVFEAPGFKAYSPRKKEVLEPIMSSRRDKNSRLDLVA